MSGETHAFSLPVRGRFTAGSRQVRRRFAAGSPRSLTANLVGEGRFFASSTEVAPRRCEALMDTIRKEAHNLDRLLRRTEAAKYVTDTFGLPCSPRTLAKLACVSSRGPPFRLAGRIPLYAHYDDRDHLLRSIAA